MLLMSSRFRQKLLLVQLNLRGDTTVIIALKFTPLVCEKGILLQAEKASYIKSFDPVVSY